MEKAGLCRSPWLDVDRLDGHVCRARPPCWRDLQGRRGRQRGGVGGGRELTGRGRWFAVSERALAHHDWGERFAVTVELIFGPGLSGRGPVQTRRQARAGGPRKSRCPIERIGRVTEKYRRAGFPRFTAWILGRFLLEFRAAPRRRFAPAPIKLQDA